MPLSLCIPELEAFLQTQIGDICLRSCRRFRKKSSPARKILPNDAFALFFPAGEEDQGEDKFSFFPRGSFFSKRELPQAGRTLNLSSPRLGTHLFFSERRRRSLLRRKAELVPFLAMPMHDAFPLKKPPPHFLCSSLLLISLLYASRLFF